MKREGGEILLYNLYENTSYRTIWGDGEQGTYKGDFAFGKDGGEKEFFVYGSIRAQQNVAAQSFEDRLTITIEW
jgi:spore coat protein U-like protein